MRRQVLLLALVISALGASAAVATQCNYDLFNTGGLDAWDVAVVIRGNVDPNGFYNGTFGGPPIVTPGAGTTTLHWINPPGPIKNGDMVHVGYTPVGTDDCPVIDIYWTDKNGRRISSSFVGVVYNHLKGTTLNISNLTLRPVKVYDIRMACQKTALPLDALNATNEYLAGAMVPVADSAILQPEQTWEIPVRPTCVDCYCVTNFKTTGDGFGAIYSPFVQEYIGLEE